jgi:hypothetical protein
MDIPSSSGREGEEKKNKKPVSRILMLLSKRF